ncbi:tRNA (guanine(9)-N(1))-methyltransferase [Lithohypha guttulata]|uniref:tRNA (guanine(9)-N(1))-methyltransferase n=1 Tax=Lithohypha guttulata TaxID=1690604 RepID=UPI002DE10557|nr:tRNA (guanine(9)-N(1))-methyltransferase [Lithohypha guttulata]
MEAEERPTKLRKTQHTTHDIDDGEYEGYTTSEAHQEPAQTAEGAATTGITADSPVAEDKDIEIETNDRDTDPTETPDDIKEASTPGEPTLSKNQQKKAKRRAEWEAGREDRKVKRREKAKELKARRKAAKEEQKQQPQNGNGDEHAQTSLPAQVQGQLKPLKRYRVGRPVPLAIVFDCGYDNLMTEREIISLGSQLTRAYSDNSRALYQTHLYVSGWSPQTDLRQRFDGLLRGVYKNWKGIKFVDSDFVTAAAMARQTMEGKRGGKMMGAFEKYAPPKKQETDSAENGTVEAENTQDNTEAVSTANNNEHNTPPIQDPSEQRDDDHLKSRSEIIYLTSDSPYNLTELKPYHTYIIGGLVDKNRHKGICYKTALDANSNPKTKQLLNGREIKTAKLPIDQYMAMVSRPILASSHVVEIMVRWLECGDWGRAFMEVMPKRKGAVLKEKKRDKNGEGGAGRSGQVEQDKEEEEAEQDDDEVVEESDSEADNVPAQAGADTTSDDTEHREVSS